MSYLCDLFLIFILIFITDTLVSRTVFLEYVLLVSDESIDEESE